MSATMIRRMGIAAKVEAISAISALVNEIGSERWAVSADGRRITDTEDGSRYGMVYYRMGEEVIAVPDFYLGEDRIDFTGSRGGEYILNGETLEKA